MEFKKVSTTLQAEKVKLEGEIVKLNSQLDKAHDVVHNTSNPSSPNLGNKTAR